MRIISLEAENVKRLRAVEIHPDGTVQIVGGRNAQGKTSVLDAIWLALGGGQAGKATSRPIRDGEDTASVRLDLGDLIVTRSWGRKGSGGQTTSLSVTAADGAKYSSPQKMLDELIGRLSFDPLAFTRLSAREQREALVDLVGIDTDTIDAERERLYAERTEVGRQGKALGDPTVDAALPAVEQSAGDLIAEIRAAEAQNRKVDDARARIADLNRRADNLDARIEQMERELEEAKAHARQAESAIDEAHEALESMEAARQTADLEAQLASVEETNAKIRANNEAKAVVETKARLREGYEALTDQIAKLDKQKADTLAAAQFPVDGLSFDSEGVLYEGVPFSQASSAEQIRVSLGMAMALNPKLRVIRITDGSLLDADSLQLIREAAAEHDFQCWIERVGGADEGAVVIEDGQVQA